MRRVHKGAHCTCALLHPETRRSGKKVPFEMNKCLTIVNFGRSDGRWTSAVLLDHLPGRQKLLRSVGGLGEKGEDVRHCLSQSYN
jgi:hypothetical protein